MRKINTQRVRIVGIFGLITACLLISDFAMAYTPEAELLRIKGYSPELINTMQTQRSRQEWRQPPAPTLTPVQRFFRNIYYSEWTGSVDEFGSQILRGK